MSGTVRRKRKQVPPVERMARYIAVDPNTGCHNWTGTISPCGYGRLTIEGRSRDVHRFAYETFKAPIPQGLVIDHLCRNRACVNPAHLEAVTQRENLRRGAGGPGENSRKTHCKRGHPFDEANTYVARGQRTCRACNLAAVQRYAARKAQMRSADRARGAVAGGMLRLVAEEDGSRSPRLGN